MNVLNIEMGRALADEGVARSEESAPEDYKAVTYAALVRVAGKKIKLTSDDVWEELGYVLEKASFLGSVFRRAAKEGVIQLALGEVRLSARPEHHRKPLRVWNSLRMAA